MAWTFLRHTTPDVPGGTCYGRTDLALAGSFEAEFAALLKRLPDVSVILSSPLQRCHLLAERIGQARGLAVERAPLWVEMDFGAWEGQLWADLPRAALDAWSDDFMGYDGHGGESVAALHQRVEGALSHLPHNALVVSHNGVFKSVAVHAGLRDGWEASLDFGAYHRFD